MHITVQLFAEILLGALLKIGLHIIDRKFRKTDFQETTARKVLRAAIKQDNALISPIAAEYRRLCEHSEARDAARAAFVDNYLAMLADKKHHLLKAERSAGLAGELTRANELAKLSF